MCPGDVAVYQCNVSGSSLEWELNTPSSDSITLSLTNHIMSVINDILGSSPVSAQLIVNGTSLTSTLSLQVALHFNGTTVGCERNTLTLNIRCKVL